AGRRKATKLYPASRSRTPRSFPWGSPLYFPRPPKACSKARRQSKKLYFSLACSFQVMDFSESEFICSIPWLDIATDLPRCCFYVIQVRSDEILRSHFVSHPISFELSPSCAIPPFSFDSVESNRLLSIGEDRQLLRRNEVGPARGIQQAKCALSPPKSMS